MQNNGQSHNKGTRTVERAQPLLGQRASEIQPYGTVAHYPLALDAQAIGKSPAIPSISCTSYSINTIKSRSPSSIPSWCKPIRPVTPG